MTQIYYLIAAYGSQMVASINSAIFGGGRGGGRGQLIKLCRALRREHAALGSTHLLR